MLDTFEAKQSEMMDRKWMTDNATIGLPFILFSATNSPPPRAGETVQLEACLKTASGQVRVLDDSEVTWISRDKAVATIDSSGLVTLLRPGQAQIVLACKTCPPFHVTPHVVDTRHLIFVVYPAFSEASRSAR